MAAQNPDSKKDFRRLVAPGAAIVGQAAGVALDLFVPGAAGPFAAAALGPALEHTILSVSTEFTHKQLAAREQVRIGGVMAAATIRIDERLKAGDTLRDDGFFDEQPGERAAASEIYEGALVAAQREHKENKVPFLGKLLASIAFDDEIDRGQANLLIRLAKEVSYRQLCILALLGEREILAEFDPPPDDLYIPELREGAYRGRPSNINEWAVLQEAWDLQVRSLAYVGPTAMDHRFVSPAEMSLMNVGVTSIWRWNSGK